MKKLVVLSAVLSLALVAVGCGGDAAPAKKDNKGGAAPTTSGGGH